MCAFLPTIAAILAVAGPPPADATATFGGAIMTQGTVLLQAPKSLNAAILELGGFAANADRRRIAVRNVDGSTRLVDLTRTGTVHAVLPGNSVTVPSVDPSRSVFLQGSIQNALPLDFQPGLTLQDAIRLAAPTKSAAVGRIQLKRAAPDGKALIQTYSFAELMAENAAPVPLAAGDTVEVPYAAIQAKSDRELLTIAVIGLLIILLLK